ncbi:unnamed protein product, partial [marine sediment metagenome]
FTIINIYYIIYKPILIEKANLFFILKVNEHHKGN